MIKSLGQDNVDISRRYSIWATTPRNEALLADVYRVGHSRMMMEVVVVMMVM